MCNGFYCCYHNRFEGVHGRFGSMHWILDYVVTIQWSCFFFFGQREEQMRKEQERLEEKRKKEEERARKDRLKEQERIEKELKREAERQEKESKKVSCQLMLFLDYLNLTLDIEVENGLNIACAPLMI